MSPRALIVLGLGLGYPASAWLRFDRGEYLGSVGAFLASLALFWVAASIAASRNRKARLAARREERRAGLRLPETESEWREFADLLQRHDAAELEASVRRGPLKKIGDAFPVIFFWLGTLGLLFAPRTAVPESIPLGARGLSAIAALTLVAVLVSVVISYAGWRQARTRVRRESTRAV